MHGGEGCSHAAVAQRFTSAQPSSSFFPSLWTWRNKRCTRRCAIAEQTQTYSTGSGSGCGLDLRFAACHSIINFLRGKSGVEGSEPARCDELHIARPHVQLSTMRAVRVWRRGWEEADASELLVTKSTCRCTAPTAHTFRVNSRVFHTKKCDLATAAVATPR